MRRHRRAVIIGGLVAFAIVVAFAGWLAKSGLDAKSALEQARSNAQQAKDALQQGDSEAASRFVDHAQYHAQAASDATHSLPWTVTSAIPWVGSPFRTGQQISDVVLGLANDVLKPAAQAGTALSPDRLVDGSRVDVALLRSEEPNLTSLAEAATRLNSEAQAISDPRYVSTLSDARTQLQEQTAQITGLLENTALASRLVPPMMGADGPRSYFMAFQTNAEARGTGGLLGGFGVLRFDNGVATVDTLGANTALDKPFTPIDLGAEFNQNYGYANPFSDFRNSNLSPHFPYAAQIWKSMWAQQTGMNVDGVIALDPFALSYILGAVGPVTMPDGEQVTKDNVVELTESTAYARFPTDQAARKQYLQDIASEVVKKVTSASGSPRVLLEALGKAANEGRIAVWSAVPAEQELLEQTPLAHIVPDDDAPYAAVVLNNLGGNKMDYYLEREIEYVADRCDGDTRNSTVTIRLKNAAPSGPLPDYVASAGGLNPDLPVKLPNGSMATSVKLLATNGAKLQSGLANGERTQVFVGTERGHPTFEVQVLIPPGQSGELTFRLSEPTVAGTPRVPIQPLVDGVAPVVSVPECSK
ncbi:membrane protein [Mycolicibacterium neoaurum]|uniref:Membrane protein n=1 Tax=Mycolicibacterium neoaurum VKM Ac-1815D TaxID=700508 RepID=V5X8T9_MYCNE|nr:membrane protein [Mycolicibacterium neoaurum VKM Ac-1815D]AMO08110.1 membrane protein [Mycolicibacterium neoaurum]KJQ52348.1 membrane protein [Mycolicibacterium neoaurum]KUM10586.1 hypothetical protein AVZ31_00905 [Mycolicibacterium neoaurum]